MTSFLDSESFLRKLQRPTDTRTETPKSDRLFSRASCGESIRPSGSIQGHARKVWPPFCRQDLTDESFADRRTFHRSKDITNISHNPTPTQANSTHGRSNGVARPRSTAACANGGLQRRYLAPFAVHVSAHRLLESDKVLCCLLREGGNERGLLGLYKYGSSVSQYTRKSAYHHSSPSL